MHGWSGPTQENGTWRLKLLPKFSMVCPTWREVVLKLKAPDRWSDWVPMSPRRPSCLGNIPDYRCDFSEDVRCWQWRQNSLCHARWASFSWCQHPPLWRVTLHRASLLESNLCLSPLAHLGLDLCFRFLKRKPGPKDMAPLSCLLAVDKEGNVRNVYKGNLWRKSSSKMEGWD